MSNRYSLLSFVGLFMMLSSCAGYKVVKLGKDVKTANKSGVIYALPATQLKVDVAVNKVLYIKGPFAEYAEKFLNVSDVIKEDKVLYEFKNVSVNTQTIADPNQYYFLKIPHLTQFRRINISLNNLGVLTGINLMESNAEVIYAKKTEELTASELAKYTHPFLTSNLKVDVDTIFERVHEDTAVIERKRYNKSLKQKSNEEKAREASEKIFRLRDVRMNLISGEQETAYDKNTLRLMLDELSKVEQEYIELFTGTSVVVPLERSFTYIPSDSSKIADSMILFKFSEEEGFVNCDSCDARPVYISVVPIVNCSVARDFACNMEVKTKNPKGFAYRVPQIAKVRVMEGDNVRFESSINIAQFGVLSRIPIRRKMNGVIFNSQIGSLKTVNY